MTPCCREKTVIYSSVKEVQRHTRKTDKQKTKGGSLMLLFLA